MLRRGMAMTVKQSEVLALNTKLHAERYDKFVKRILDRFGTGWNVEFRRWYRPFGVWLPIWRRMRIQVIEVGQHRYRHHSESEQLFVDFIRSSSWLTRDEKIEERALIWRQLELKEAKVILENVELTREMKRDAIMDEMGAAFGTSLRETP